MLEAWKDLPWWVKTIGILLVFLLGLFIMLFVSTRLGAGTIGVSLIMLIFSTKDKSEKSGYNF